MAKAANRALSAAVATEPSARARRTIEAMAAFGIPEAQIARAHGLSRAELEQRYAEELATGKAKADAKVVEALYNQAIGGNVAAASFWCKARLGWRERPDYDEGGDEVVSQTQAQIEAMSSRELARLIALTLVQADVQLPAPEPGKEADGRMSTAAEEAQQVPAKLPPVRDSP